MRSARTARRAPPGRTRSGWADRRSQKDMKRGCAPPSTRERTDRNVRVADRSSLVTVPSPSRRARVKERASGSRLLDLPCPLADRARTTYGPSNGREEQAQPREAREEAEAAVARSAPRAGGG